MFTFSLFFAKIFSATRKLYEDILRSEREYPRQTAGGKQYVGKVFKLKENHTDVKTEILAGITTFMTMAYILAVNPSILSAAGMDQGAVFTATALASSAFAYFPES